MAKVYWKMSVRTYDKYVETLVAAARAERDGDTVRHQQLKEEIQLLPGFPHHRHPTEDIIVPVPDDEPSRELVSLRSN